MKIDYPKFFRTGGFFIGLFFASLATSLFAQDTSTKLVAGSKLDRLTVGSTTYQNVLVRSVSARSAMITYDGGMKSILLRNLPQELQQRFGYNPDAERAQEAAAKAGQAAAEQQQRVRLEDLRKKRQAEATRFQGDAKIDRLMDLFGQPPEINKEVDLRSRYNELGLWVKDQGWQPSCAIFAIVSALEYQSAEVNGTSERFSEEYLIWATRKTLRRALQKQESSTSDIDDRKQRDIGFTLDEVVLALRTYGIPPRDKVPAQFSGGTNEPPPEIIEEARKAKHVAVHQIPGRDKPTAVANIVQALNAGVPVPIGIRWPGAVARRAGYLDAQLVFDGYHAVTLVGYKSKTGSIEDTVFTFKNSWGIMWGVNGYGSVTYRYLIENLHSAVILEVSAR